MNNELIGIIIYLVLMFLLGCELGDANVKSSNFIKITAIAVLIRLVSIFVG